MENFLLCFKIAKTAGGVLYSGLYNRGFAYSICRDLYGEPLVDFRIGKTGKAARYGRELSSEERKEFYNVEK